MKHLLNTIRLLLVLQVMYFQYSIVFCSKSTFTKTSDDELPLSSKYRDSLRKLCKIIKDGGKLPSSAEADIVSLKKQCKKLQSDDNNISSVFDITNMSKDQLILSIVGIGCAVMYFQYGDKFNLVFAKVWTFLSQLWKRFTRKQHTSHIAVKSSNSFSSDDDNIRRIKEIREARLKRLGVTEVTEE